MLSIDAQRLLPMQRGLEISTGVPLIRGEKLFQGQQFNAGMMLTQYFHYSNYAFLSADYELQQYRYKDRRVPCQDLFLQIGYMHPILSDARKNLFFYLGASALCGHEEVNEGEDLLFDGATLLDHSSFIYGGAVHASVELFLLDNFLFILRGENKLFFGGDLNKLRPSLSVGFRINL